MKRYFLSTKVPSAKRHRPEVHACAAAAATAVAEAEAAPCAPEVLIDESTLSESQRRVVEAAMTGESFFFTGAAGTGKSYVLKYLPKILSRRVPESQIYMTASTGIAACAVGGTTLHSFAGVGLGDSPAMELLEKLRGGRAPSAKSACARWTTASVLIIEECSMVPPDLFEKLNLIAQNLRGTMDKPFGGLQVILCGDFFQLPPVNKDKKPGQADFLFETNAWKRLIGDRVYMLGEIFRQKEPEFLNMLDDFRRGVIGEQAMATFQERRRVTDMMAALPEDTVKLFSTRKEADAVNSFNLSKLAGEAKSFVAVDKGEPYTVQKLADHWMAPQTLVLKEGAAVMFVYNVSLLTGVVNGMTGRVTGFSVGDGYPVVRCSNGAEMIAAPVKWEIKSSNVVVASRTQVPLILSYAITTHKSQGMSIRHVEVNTAKIFEYGQCYVALSRGMSLDGLFIRGPLPPQELISPHPKVLQWWGSVLGDV